MLYSRSFLFIYFIYSSFYLFIPNTQFIPPSLVTIKFSVLCLWVYFCFVNKFILLFFFKDSTYK